MGEINRPRSGNAATSRAGRRAAPTLRVDRRGILAIENQNGAASRRARREWKRRRAGRDVRPLSCLHPYAPWCIATAVRDACCVVLPSRRDDLRRHTNKYNAPQNISRFDTAPVRRSRRNSAFSSEMSADAGSLFGAPETRGVRVTIHALKGSARTSRSAASMPHGINAARHAAKRQLDDGMRKPRP